jgi:hypothetical protein
LLWRLGGLFGGDQRRGRTYPKVTVDAKGRVTGGTTLASGDLPAHTYVATDIDSGSLLFTVQTTGRQLGRDGL